MSQPQESSPSATTSGLIIASLAVALCGALVVLICLSALTFGKVSMLHMQPDLEQRSFGSASTLELTLPSSTPTPDFRQYDVYPLEDDNPKYSTP